MSSRSDDADARAANDIAAEPIRNGVEDPMKILVISVVHTPLDARIHHRQIAALRAAGITVTQVAPWTATGVPPEDALDGVIAIDIPRAVGRHRLAAFRAARRIVIDLAPRHDLVLLHDPELVLSVVGRLHRLPPVVLDVHEDLTASLTDRRWLPEHLRGLAAQGVGQLERWSERHLASLLLAEAGYRPRFRRDHPVVPNLPWRATGRPTPTHTDQIVYVGRVSAGRGAHELLAIAEQLAEQHGPRLEIVGTADDDVSEALRDADERGTLRWHGFLPNDEAMAIVRGSLAGLAPLHDLPNYRVSLPTKVVEYLAHGVPAIVTPLPEAVRLVRAAGAGIVVPFGDVDQTVREVLALAADPARRARLGASARAYVDDNANWDSEATRFVTHLRDLVGPTPTGSAHGATGGGMEPAPTRVVDQPTTAGPGASRRDGAKPAMERVADHRAAVGQSSGGRP